jgi:tRNA (guanine37-N1)-methyltransferase
MIDPLFKVCILTLFPEMFPGPLGYSLAKKALDNNIWQLDLINIRNYALGSKGHLIDDKPYGGGSGMVLRADVIAPAIDKAIENTDSKNIIYMSPRGRTLDQSLVKDLVARKNLVIICGRFEGIDERIIEEYNIEEISVGDYILSGGEIACMALIDSCLRLLPGVIENINTLEEESFISDNIAGLLEYPLYTRPESWRERRVPSVLTSGNHSNVADWKKEKSQEITKERRPDLWKKYKE